MRLTEAALRKIVREEIVALYEGRSNTFMLSRMEETELEEQDRDGDGDSDFDDVRVARFTASGMPKNKALDKVKRKPLGTPPKKKVNEDVTAIRVLVQEILMLNELQFQTGYTSDPRFSSSEPTAAPSVATPVKVAAFDKDLEVGDTNEPRTVDIFLASSPAKKSKFGKVTVTDLYGTRDGKHKGIDLSAGKGTPIYAALGGAVNFAGKDTRADGSFDPGGNAGPNGNYVKITHDDRTATYYLHLDTVTVITDSTVAAGAQIGTMGNTGRVRGSGGVHLHFHTADDTGSDIDPLIWMNAHPTAIFPVKVD